MQYSALISKVQDYTGLSPAEAKDALDCMVEILAVHLTEPERKDFASQLPEELQDIALAVFATEQNTHEDIFTQYMANLHVREPRAKKDMLAAWKALKEAISSGEISHILAQLPKKTVALLG